MAPTRRPQRSAAQPPALARGGRVADVDQDNQGIEEVESVETAGATFQEAVQKALDLLGLSREEVEVEVLRTPGSDQEARVRVTALPYEDEEYDEEEGPEAEGEEGEPAPTAAANGAEVGDEDYEELPLSETATAAADL